MPPSPRESLQRSGGGRAIGWSAGARLAADVTGRGLQFLLFYAAQRTLGPVSYGHLTIALAAGFLMSAATDLGVPLIVTREISRRPEEAARIAGAGLALRMALVIPAAAILVAVALSRRAVWQETLLLSLATLVASAVEMIGYVLRGLNRVHQETMVLSILRMLTVLFGGWALWSAPGLTRFAVAYLAATLCALTVACAWLWRIVTPRVRLDRAARDLFAQALPLGGATLLSIAHTRTGVFVLDAVAGPATVGLYGIAQKLTEPLSMIPAALMAALFPVVSRSTGDAALARLKARGVQLLAAAGALAALAGVLAGPWLIYQMYPGDYAGAAPILQILALSILPVFVNYALTHFLVADDRQGHNLAFTAIVFGVNLTLCVTAAPRWGAAGVAASLLVSELVLFGLCATAMVARPRAVAAR